MKTTTTPCLIALFAILAAVAPMAAGAQAPQYVQEQPAVAPPPSPTPIPAVPDDPRLAQFVKLVQAGLSESLIAETVRTSAAPYKLTVNDLIYLKDNKVPESIIAAMLTVGAPAAPGTEPAPAAVPIPEPTPEPPKEIVIDGLVLKTGGFFKKNRAGTMIVTESEFEWRDATDSTGNFTLYPEGIKDVQMTCRPGTEERFCYEINIDMAKGDDFSFTDAERDRGGNRNVVQLQELLVERYPDVTVTTKIKK